MAAGGSRMEGRVAHLSRTRQALGLHRFPGSRVGSSENQSVYKQGLCRGNANMGTSSEQRGLRGGGCCPSVQHTSGFRVWGLFGVSDLGFGVWGVPRSARWDSPAPARVMPKVNFNQPRLVNFIGNNLKRF